MLQFTDRTSPMDRHVSVLGDTYGIAAAPITPQMFASAGKEHMAKYGNVYTLPSFMIRLSGLSVELIR